MQSSASISISKLDAARRQLETSVRLYFSNEDPISIHTMASAAFAVLEDIGKSQGLEVRHSRSSLLEMAKPGREKEMQFYIKRHENFFKHANRDPDANIDFNPAVTEWVIFDAIAVYARLTSEQTPLMKTFNGWWQYTYRHLLKPEFQLERARF